MAARQQYFMPFYRFSVCDPINPIDGHRHDGAALADDIDAMLFAAGIVQRLVQEYPSISRSWAIAITEDARKVNVLTFEAGCKVLVRSSHWDCDQPRASEGWR
jgi:hypothetical protein